MGRPRAKLDVLGEAERLKQELRKQKAGIVRERMQAVTLGLEGELSLPEIAAQLGRSRATIQNWLNTYREKGVAGLRESGHHRAGRKAALDERGWKQFRKKLNRGSFRTVRQAQQWVEQQLRVQRSEETVRRWMGKLGARLKVVRPRHPRSKHNNKQAFREQLARVGYQALLDKGAERWRQRPLRLWVADEARFGLQTSHRRAWVSRGVRAHKDSTIRYDWQYVWAALQIGGGGSEFLYTNKADTEMSGSFLEQISRRDPHAIHLVIWDGAGFHPHHHHASVPENIV
ncbi:MAG: IS630 family transposase, partial [Verrucomicrobiota bacterium]